MTQRVNDSMFVLEIRKTTQTDGFPDTTMESFIVVTSNGVGPHLRPSGTPEGEGSPCRLLDGPDSTEALKEEARRVVELD